MLVMFGVLTLTKAAQGRANMLQTSLPWLSWPYRLRLPEHPRLAGGAQSVLELGHEGPQGRNLQPSAKISGYLGLELLYGAIKCLSAGGCTTHARLCLSFWTCA